MSPVHVKSEVRRPRNQEPFRRFVVSFAAGEWVVVEYPQNIAFDPVPTGSAPFAVVSRYCHLLGSLDAVVSVELLGPGDGGTSVSTCDLAAAVRAVLFWEWDPIGVNGYINCQDEYDAYVPAVVGLLTAGAVEATVARQLEQFAVGHMGLPAGDADRHRRVARRLVGLRASASAGC